MRPELLALAAGLAAREEPFALVTVVRREPPSSARVGDTALVTAGGDYHGWAGGGCTRSTVVREALRAIADGEPRLLSLAPETSDRARPGLIALPMTCDSGGTVEIYVEPILPVPRLLLFGSSPAVRVLSGIGRAMGYRVEVIGQDAAPADFPGASVRAEAAPGAIPRGAYVVVATMGDRDLEILDAVVSSAPAYVGVVASRKRFDPLRDALLAQGVSREALDRIAAPAGLDIGARTPEEIAVSIMAQIVERRRSGTKAPAEARRPEPAREAVDPICGMSVDVAGARHTAEAGGRTWYFCCAGCRTKFLAEPERYASAGGAT